MEDALASNGPHIRLLEELDMNQLNMDLGVTKSNACELMRTGQPRWRIENETFNTLKNQSYGFGHDLGHGKRYLATVFTHLTMLAFLIDQVQ